MPLTFDGRLVRPGRKEAPSLRDIALSLSRLPRFGGHTRRWWSVLDHSLYVYLLARRLDRRTYPDLLLALLLHDAHEAMTGDIPSDVKSNDMRAMQKGMDIAIIAEHFPLGEDAWAELKPFVKEYDRRALHAEAWLLGPPGLMNADYYTYEVTYGFGPRPPSWRRDVDFLVRMRQHAMFQDQPHPGIDGANVKDYIERVQTLQRAMIDSPRENLWWREGLLGQEL